VNRTGLKQKRQKRRRLHVRHDISGSAERPRLTVHKTLRNVIAQVIDDSTGRTLAYWSTLSNGNVESGGTKTEAARRVGKRIAELAREKGIETVVFDRNQYIYHGRVKAVAEGAREGGLKF
jgi:large subunit ribosomal protein L18